MIKALAHVCITTTDLEKSREFYVDILGLDIAFTFRVKEEVFGYYFRVSDNNYIEVFHVTKLPTGYSPLGHFCLEVESVDAMEKRLADANWKTNGKKIGADGTWQLWSADPSGVRVEFQEYTEKSTQFSGVDCQVDW